MYFFSELAEGSLHDLIYSKNYVPNLQESLQWAREIAEGMHLINTCHLNAIIMSCNTVIIVFQE